MHPERSESNVRPPVSTDPPSSARRLLAAVLLAAAALALAGCGGGNGDDAASGAGATTHEPEPAENIVEVQEDDPGVAAARGESQTRWPEFVASFRDDPELDHSVKVALPTDGGSTEHIWVTVTAIDGEQIEGTLANDPVGDLGVVYGDAVTVDQAQVEDWAVFRGDEVVLGGFSFDAIAAAREAGG
jgi:uncharacterized protein YegJ (DUF2314 family)